MLFSAQIERLPNLAALGDPDRARNRAQSRSLPLAQGSQTFQIETLAAKTTQPERIFSESLVNADEALIARVMKPYFEDPL